MRKFNQGNGLLEPDKDRLAAYLTRVDGATVYVAESAPVSTRGGCDKLAKPSALSPRYSWRCHLSIISLSSTYSHPVQSVLLIVVPSRVKYHRPTYKRTIHVIQIRSLKIRLSSNHFSDLVFSECDIENSLKFELFSGLVFFFGHT